MSPTCPCPPVGKEVSKTGRLRWKIENEGFRVQNHEGYNLGHRFSKVYFNAIKYDYQCPQIANMIIQLVTNSAPPSRRNSRSRGK
jgi:hypothetical protein